VHILKDQTVVTVGASSGIGLATAQAASQEGAEVVMVSRSQEKLSEAARTFARTPILRAVDMLDAVEVLKLFAQLTKVDHLVLTAAADENERRGNLVDLNEEKFESSLHKFRGFFHVTRAAVPKMAPRGSITLTSGDSAFKPSRQGMSVLGSVNAAIASFGRALALELSPIRVNVISPGVVDTPVWNTSQRGAIKSWAESKDLPAQRFGQPGDIAHAILFLMTNSYMTGHVLFVDGGLVVT
jgi:NAD(P)-dependent dehydrogenase (short-subunit alcohol dehydrogenase family)